MCETRHTTVFDIDTSKITIGSETFTENGIEYEFLYNNKEGIRIEIPETDIYYPFTLEKGPDGRPFLFMFYCNLVTPTVTKVHEIQEKLKSLAAQHNDTEMVRLFITGGKGYYPSTLIVRYPKVDNNSIFLSAYLLRKTNGTCRHSSALILDQ